MSTAGVGQEEKARLENTFIGMLIANAQLMLAYSRGHLFKFKRHHFNLEIITLSFEISFYLGYTEHSTLVTFYR